MKTQLARIEKGLEWIYQRIELSIATQSLDLELLRQLIALLILLFFIPQGFELLSIPEALFTPKSGQLGSFLGNPNWLAIAIIELGVIASCLALGIGWCDRLSYLVLGILFICGGAYAYGFGKIDHLIFLPICLLALAATPFKRDRNQPPAALTILSILLVLGMLTAGIPKLLFWLDLDPNTSGFMHWFNGTYLGLGEVSPLSPLLISLQGWPAELLDIIAIIFECSAGLFLLLGYRTWRLWLLLAIIFHWLSLQCFGIDFSPHTIVYLPFLLTDFRVHPKWKRLLRITIKLLVTWQLIIFLLRLFPGGVVVDYRVFSKASDWVIQLYYFLLLILASRQLLSKKAPT